MQNLQLYNQFDSQIQKISDNIARNIFWDIVCPILSTTLKVTSSDDRLCKTTYTFPLQPLLTTPATTSINLAERLDHEKILPTNLRSSFISISVDAITVQHELIVNFSTEKR